MISQIRSQERAHAVLAVNEYYFCLQMWVMDQKFVEKRLILTNFKNIIFRVYKVHTNVSFIPVKHYLSKGKFYINFANNQNKNVATPMWGVSFVCIKF